MEITTAMVKELRDRTGAGILESRNVLKETDGDLERAAELLRQRGMAKAAKKAERVANQGLIEAYIHGGGRVGAIVELNCETDFVALTGEFQQLAHDLAMQVVAANPRYVDTDNVPPEVLDEERGKYRAQFTAEGKPAQVVDKIVVNKLESFLDEVCLLRQPFIKEPDVAVRDLIKSRIASVGENIVVRRFARFELGTGE